MEEPLYNLQVGTSAFCSLYGRVPYMEVQYVLLCICISNLSVLIIIMIMEVSVIVPKASPVFIQSSIHSEIFRN